MNRLIVLVTILALVAGFASAQPGSSNLDTGKELVAQLYKEHSGKSDPLQYPARNYFQTIFTNRSLTSILRTKRTQKAKWIRSTSIPCTMLRILKSRISTWSCSLIKKGHGTWRPDLRIWGSTKRSSSHFSERKWDGASLTFNTRTGVRFGKY